MEPMWYCHECHAEMRPLMQPDPHCASCRGTFVEKMDDPADDPREFDNGVPDLDNMPPAFGVFLNALESMSRPPSSPRLPRSPARSPSGGGLHFSFSSSSGTGPRTIHISRGSPPTASEFSRRGPEGEGIAGNLMAQYLLAMLGGGLDRNGPMPDFFAQLSDPTQQGRMGDYVFNQEALDQIISQIMENSNAHRPVPAPDEMIKKLPREVLEEGSPMLEKDCAVCKDQFALDTEDPDEQIVVTLPCKHPFHVGCIEPWLKSSGTCPVCRHALVPQPSQDGPSGSESANQSSESNSDPARRSGDRSSSGSRMPTLFSNIFGGGGNSSSGNENNSSPSSNSGTDSPNLPGGWR